MGTICPYVEMKTGKSAISSLNAKSVIMIDKK
jgi:hypothetical protein